MDQWYGDYESATGKANIYVESWHGFWIPYPEGCMRVAVDSRIVYAALIIALIGLGASLYTNIKLTKIIEDQNKIINNINQSVAGIENVPTQEDIQELVSEIRDIQNRLQEYPTKEDLQLLEDKIRRLEQALNMTYEAIFFPAEIVDGTGDIVVIPHKPKRIVSLSPATTEILYYLGAIDRVVGVDEYSNWPEWIAEARDNGTIMNVGGFWSPNVEAILAANPDLVVGVAGATPHSQVKQILAAHGIPVILIPQESVDDVKRALIMVGIATGNVAEAAQAIQEFEENIARIQVAVPEEQRSVALIVWVNPLWVTGSETFQHDMIETIGAINVFANLTGWQSVSPEVLLEAQPQIIILSGVDRETFYQFINETLADASLEIPAVANDLIFCIQGAYLDLINRPSPRLVDGLIILQYIVYPEIYGITWDELPRCINETTLPQVPEPPAPIMVGG